MTSSQEIKSEVGMHRKDDLEILSAYVKFARLKENLP